MTDLDAIKNRLAAVHAAGAFGITVWFADYGICVLVQMQSWEGNTAHEADEAVTTLLGYAFVDLTALVAEVERLRAEVAAERAAVVAYLRACALDPEATGTEFRLLQDQATRIERGAHCDRREEDKS